MHPLPAHDRVVFLNPLVVSPNITGGDYTYYDDPDGATDFEHCNVQRVFGWCCAGPGLGPFPAALPRCGVGVGRQRKRRFYGIYRSGCH
ncbi:hypothetical protein [Streptomyces canus]|uniref:hypothetical protein n=1 Tax=Streptomyces canus TaxID=58343 RepID=UPI003868EFA1